MTMKTAEYYDYECKVPVVEIEDAYECTCGGMCAAVDHDLTNNYNRRRKLHDPGCPKLIAIDLLSKLIYNAD